MTAKGITILRATLENLDQAAPLFDMYRRFYGQASDLEGARAFLEARLAKGESVIFLASDPATGQTVGFAQMFPTFSSISMRHTWILNDLYVRGETRGRGIGRLLLEAARRHSAETGAKGLSLSTAADNKTAQGLYESFGFERDTEFYHYDLLNR